MFVGALTVENYNGVSSVEDRAQASQSWRCVELLVDSGAVDNVGDPHDFPEYAIKASEGSKAGMHYVAANKGKIRNQGEQHLILQSMDRSFGFRLKMQSAAVSRPILSVIRLVENGNDVIFRSKGGTIKNLTNGHETHFERKHGVYILKSWLRTRLEATPVHDDAVAAADFARQE